MRGLVDVIVVADTDEFVVPSAPGSHGSTAGVGHEWSLAEARGSVMLLSRKVFCEPRGREDAAQAHLLSRRERHPSLEHGGVVVAGVDALLSGSVVAHHSKQLTVHRYAECGRSRTLLGRVATAIQWQLPAHPIREQQKALQAFY